MQLPHGIKSALLHGKLCIGTSETKKIHAYLVEIAFLWRLLHSFAIQHGRFCTMWRYHARSPLACDLTKLMLNKIITTANKSFFLAIYLKFVPAIDLLEKIKRTSLVKLWCSENVIFRKWRKWEGGPKVGAGYVTT